MYVYVRESGWDKIVSHLDIPYRWSRNILHGSLWTNLDDGRLTDRHNGFGPPTSKSLDLLDYNKVIETITPDLLSNTEMVN